MAKVNQDEFSDNPHMRLYLALHREAVQLCNLVQRRPEEFDSLTIKSRGGSDFLGVLKKTDEAGQQWVCFGNGHDYVAVLLALEGSLAANRWREETPWNG